MSDGRLHYDAGTIAAFYDDYGEREWQRFESGRRSPASLAVHLHHLRRFVRPGDRVLDVGAGPGRFTIELARIGADVVVADISPRQLELNREKLEAAGLEERILERVVADVCDLARFADASFDATVCYGGPLSYVLERAPEAVAELARVTRPGGHVLVSVMSLVGPMLGNIELILDEAREFGPAAIEQVVATGLLPPELGGHTGMKLYRRRELEALLPPHGELVALSAAGILHAAPEEPELRALVERLELDLAAEPGALDAAPHMLAVVRR
jgi:ubiquinone/menaquinone biosynthesis C-methylase UbiE